MADPKGTSNQGDPDEEIESTLERVTRSAPTPDKKESRSS